MLHQISANDETHTNPTGKNRICLLLTLQQGRQKPWRLSGYEIQGSCAPILRMPGEERMVDNRKVNPTRYNKSKYTSGQIDAKYHAIGRSLVLVPDPEWDNQLAAMNRSKRGRPFVYSDILMASIAYIRYVNGKSLRVMEGVVDAILNTIKGPDHVTIWRRTCAQSVSINGDKIITKTTDGKTYVLMADSTGITTTGKGRWIEIKWNAKCNFIKLHILIEEESQKILAFRITDTGGGDAQNLPGMLDDALERLGIPLESCTKPDTPESTPDASVSVTHIPTEKSSTDIITEYLCDCGCGKTLVTDCKTTKPPVATVMADGGYDSNEAFSHCKKRGVKTVIRTRINSTVQASDEEGARSKAVLEQLGGGCTAAQFAKMSKTERKKHQKEWRTRVKSSRRWLVEIVISAFKRVLGESLRAIKPEYIIIEIATKIAAYNKTRDIMRKAMGVT